MRLVKLSALILAAGLLTGCAARSDIKRLDEEMAQLTQQAAETRRIAEQANQTAQDADRRSRMTEEMLNRSFKKSMYK